MSPRPETVPPRQARHRRLRKFGVGLLVLAVAAGVGRAFLPWAVRDYVIRTLDASPLYDGHIGDVRIHLWRGAYSIDEVRISKTTGNVPVPFFAAERVDFALEWDALLHRKLVGQIVMQAPEINFVDASNEEEGLTGAGGAWLAILGDLYPFKINSTIVHDGSVHFRVYQTPKPVDVYLSSLEGSIDNLTNIRDELNPQVATVEAKGLAMDQAEWDYVMTLDPFSYRPTFHLATRLLGLDVTKTNDLALAYGGFDFERGWFDLVVEVDAKEGLMSGYAKPLFRDLKVFSAAEDLADGNPLQAVWEALVGVVGNVFKNQPRDQFGTLIPFTGDLSRTTNADLLATVGNVLHNAFVRAYLPRLESGLESVAGLEFEAPEFTDAISTGY